jgi:alpha-L-rhamnosidase
VVGLKVDYLEQPLGLESRHPRFSWRLESEERNVRQSAYRILVASSEGGIAAGEGDIWDTGRVSSRRCFGIQYRGRGLSSRQRCWWNVQAWDERGLACPPSAASWWEMGLLDPKDWSAQWLAAEDPLAKADRETGLRWMWGRSSDDRCSRGFRLRVRLPVASQTGELFAVVNYPFGKVANVWVDGVLVSTTESHNPSGQRFILKALDAGEHLIAIEVKPVVLPPAFAAILSGSRRVQGCTVFVRLQLESGETWRLGAGPSWETSLVQDSAWPTPEYDSHTWETAQLVDMQDRQPWPATPAMHFRKEFTVNRAVARARLYATALGVYEARLNGSRVSDALLAPEPSQYRKRALYQVYDVTDIVAQGANLLGLTVGDGWYASFDGRFEWGSPPRRILAQLELTFTDGSRQVIATGDGWRAAESPIRSAEVRVGEFYDARLEQPGWDVAGFDDSHWQEPDVADAPLCALVAQTSPPIRITETLKPVSISRLRPGVYRFDFGQNLSGWCRLHVCGVGGSRVELVFGEVLTAAGEVDQSFFTIGEPKNDVYILRGAVSGETFEPRFTYRGFRYVVASGLTTEPTAESLEGVFVHSDLTVTGRLRIDDPLLEQIWRMTVRTQRSNFVGIPTDCPSREQRGWMADAGIFWDAAAFNMDVCAFTSRQMANVADDQMVDGSLPPLSPMAPRFVPLYQSATPPGWGDGAIILPWTAWRRYGDLAVIERNWQMMNDYLKFVLAHNPDYVFRHNRGLDFGDWLSVEGPDYEPNTTTPGDLIGTAYWGHSADLMTQMAEALGRTQEAAHLRTQFACIRRAFNASFVAADGTVGNGSQTSYVLALRFDLLPEAIKGPAAERLAESVRQQGVALTTGILGTQFILDVLSDTGFADLAFGLLLRTDYPSWGYMIRNGATTVWENWRGENHIDGRLTKISQNHYALGAICGFLFRRVAGIDAASPGFEGIVVRPVMDARVTRAGGDYDSLMGRISTDWSREDNRFSLEVSIPTNSSARIHLPASLRARIEESDRELDRCKDLRVVDRGDSEAVLDVGSGRYRFSVSEPVRQAESDS